MENKDFNKLVYCSDVTILVILAELDLLKY